MNAGATLADLDDFLRGIWLECCGHLSSFDIEGVTYTVPHYGEPLFERGIRIIRRDAKNVTLPKVLPTTGC